MLGVEPAFSACLLPELALQQSLVRNCSSLPSSLETATHRGKASGCAKNCYVLATS